MLPADWSAMDVVRALTKALPAALCIAVATAMSPQAQTPSNPSPAGQAPSAVAERMQLGRDAMSRRAFAEARDHFARVLQLDWNNPQAYTWWFAAKDSAAAQMRQYMAAGDQSMAAGRYAQAMVAYFRAFSMDSTRADTRRKFLLAGRKADAQGCLAAGLAYFLRGKYDSVRVMVDSALARDPENADAAVFAGQIEPLLPGSRAGEGLEQDAEAWGWHVEALKSYRAGDYPAAIALWEKILAKYPGHPDAVANIRQARLRLQAESKPAGEMAEGGK